MKTNKKFFVGAVVVALALVSVSMVSADTTAVGPGNGGFGRGYGEEEDGLLADYMEAVIADSLGLTVEELDAFEAEGVTHFDIAMEKGLSVEEFNTILDNARDEAIALAAADGITIQMRAEDGLRNGNGNRTVNMEDCTEETCVAQPVGTGIGRGGRK